MLNLVEYIQPPEQIDYFGGCPVCARTSDIRAFFASDDGWIATGKGLAIKPALLDEVIEGLRKAQVRAREEGLV